MPYDLLYSNIAYVFRYLTRDASAPSTTHEPEIDKRVAESLEMKDPDIIIDLREQNHSTSDKFKLIWEQCKAYLQEVTAVHKRRHDQDMYRIA